MYTQARNTANTTTTLLLTLAGRCEPTQARNEKKKEQQPTRQPLLLLVLVLVGRCESPDEDAVLQEGGARGRERAGAGAGSLPDRPEKIRRFLAQALSDDQVQ